MPTEQLGEERTAPVGRSRHMSPEFWAIIGIGATILIGLGAGQMSMRQDFRGEIQSLRDDHREDFMLLLQEIRNLREEVTANGKVLARIEQALFGPPAKITPADAK